MVDLCMMYDFSIDCCSIYLNGAVFDYFSHHKETNSNPHALQISRHHFHGHPFLRMDEYITATMGTAINLLRYSTMLISLKVIKIVQISSKGVSRRGSAKLLVSFVVGVLQRVMALGPAAA
jgi:hypothetical protein